MENNYSLSDLAVATGNGWGNNGWGGIGTSVIAGVGGGLLANALFSNGGWGNNNCNRGNCATTEDLASGFNFSALQGKTNDILAAVNNVNQNLGNAVCSSTYELGSKIDNCCCNTQIGVQQVRYDMAVQNGDIKSLIHSEAEATRNMMRDTENANLRQQLNYSQMQQLMCGIPRVSTTAWGVYQLPSCSGYTGCNNCAY